MGRKYEGIRKERHLLHGLFEANKMENTCHASTEKERTVNYVVGSITLMGWLINVCYLPLIEKLKEIGYVCCH